MAEAIGIAILSPLLSAGVATTVGIAGVSLATITGTAAILGSSAALSALTSTDQAKQKVSAQQLSLKQSIPARRKGYGRTKTAGPYIAYDSYRGAFRYAIYHGEGPDDANEEFWLDDKKSTIPAGTLQGFSGIDPWKNNVVIESHLGTEDQAASSALMELPYWSTDHRLAGCSYTVVKCVYPSAKRFPQIFPQNAPPALRVVRRRSRVRDVRDPAQTVDPATWAWTNLSGPCIFDHVTNRRTGIRVPIEFMDLASWRVFNDRCAETVITKAGVTIPRYTLGGEFELTDDPASVLQAMLDTCDGRIDLTPEGLVAISGGAFPEPTVTLTDADIRSITIEDAQEKLYAFNRLKISFTSPEHDYQLIEGDAWDNLASQAASGETEETDFSRPWINNHNQLRRLAKIFEAKGNPRWRISNLVTHRSGIRAAFEESIRLKLEEFDIDIVVLVQRSAISGGRDSCSFELVSIEPTAYTFNAQLEEGRAPALPNAQALPADLDPPVDLAAAIDRRAVSGDTNATFLVLTADEPERDDLSLIGRYRAVGATDWIDMVADGDSRGRVISSVLVDGQAYEAQGAIAGYGRSTQSAWLATDPATITAVADTVSPGAPTSFVANGGAGQFSYAFTTPNTPNFGYAKSYGNTVPDLASADELHTFNGAAGQAFDRTETGLAPGPYYVWIRAFNRSGLGDAASTDGPLTATVS